MGKTKYLSVPHDLEGRESSAMPAVVRAELFGKATPLEVHALAHHAAFYPQTAGVFGGVLAQAIAPFPLTDTKYERDHLAKYSWPTEEDHRLLFSNELTSFGVVLRELMPHATLIDFGSGDAAASLVPRTLAVAWGARAYVGIDNGAQVHDQVVEYVHAPFGCVLPQLATQNPDCTATLLREEMLTALTHMSGNQHVIFYLGGLEPCAEQWDHVRQQHNADFCNAVADELARVVGTRGAVVCGPGTTGFPLEGHLRCMLRKPWDEKGNDISIWLPPIRWELAQLLS